MAYDKNYYEKNKVKIRQRQSEYRRVNPKYRESVKNWNDNNPDKMKEYRLNYNNSPKGKLTKLRLRARHDNIPFNIDINEWLSWFNKQDFYCYYCGIETTFNGDDRMKCYSIDRKDNDIGYEISNIVLSCNRCNLAKGSWFSEDEMLEIAAKYFI